ncbi:MAG: hypothetical protein ACYTG4_06930 [Planctomycetota bacterium]|jgi:hypothetical protein
MLFPILFAGGCIAFFARGAKEAGKPQWLWAGLSLAISLLFILVIPLGFFGLILGQLGLFVGLTIMGVMEDKRRMRAQDQQSDS